MADNNDNSQNSQQKPPNENERNTENANGRDADSVKSDEDTSIEDTRTGTITPPVELDDAMQNGSYRPTRVTEATRSRALDDFKVQMGKVQAIERASRENSEIVPEFDESSNERKRTEELLSADFQIFEDGRPSQSDYPQPPDRPTSSPRVKLGHVVNVPWKTLKTGLLLAIWLVFSFQFITQKSLPFEEHMVSVLPNEMRMFFVPNYTDAVSVTVSGPFLEESSAAYTGYDDPRAKVVSITAVRIFYDSNLEPLTIMSVSETWHEYLVDSSQEQLQKPTDRFIVLDLWQNISRDSKTRMFLNIVTNINWAITLKFCYDWYPVDKVVGLILGAIVLVLMLIMLIYELCSNTLIAILCSSLALAFISILNPPPVFNDVLTWIDMRMLMLLFSMMIIIDIMSEAGAFDYITVYAYELSGGDPWRLIQSLCVIISLIAAVINNSTMMMLTAPIVINLCEISGLDPVKVLICLVMCANIGSSFTPIGCTPNVIVTNEKHISESGINFGNFVIHILPCSALALLQTLCLLRRFFGEKEKLRYVDPETAEKDKLKRRIKRWSRAQSTIGNFTRDGAIMSGVINRLTNSLQQKLDTPLERGEEPVKDDATHFKETLEELKSKHGIRNVVLLIQALISLGLVILLFLLRSLEELSLLSFAWAALLGALLLLVMAIDYCEYGEFDALLNRLDWSSLIFIASLFVMVEALSRLGYSDLISTLVLDVVLSVDKSLQLFVAMMMILWLTAISSILLNNNPVTTMMVRIVIALSKSKELKLPLHPLVWALVLGANFGANGTMVSASPNIVTAGVADKHAYKFKYGVFFTIGITITFFNLILASVYLALFHVVFEWH